MNEQYQVGSYPVSGMIGREDHPIFDNEETAIQHAQELVKKDEYSVIGIWELNDGDATLQYLVCADGVFVYS